jgi:hypothetical protein
MEVAGPGCGSVLREVVTREFCEGHCFGFAASLLPWKEALAKPKDGASELRPWDPITN